MQQPPGEARPPTASSAAQAGSRADWTWAAFVDAPPRHGDAADIGSLQRIKVRPAELAAKLRISFCHLDGDRAASQHSAERVDGPWVSERIARPFTRR
jgi:hypothetical protein